MRKTASLLRLKAPTKAGVYSREQYKDACERRETLFNMENVNRTAFVLKPQTAYECQII